MRSLFIISILGIALFSCNQKKQNGTGNTGKKDEKPAFTIDKNGIGELKIGMSQPELEKLLGQKFNFNPQKEAAGYWQDTVKVKYKDIDVSLFFERQYVDEDSSSMQLAGVETSSPLCKTATGIGIGNDKASIIAAYNDNPIDMGPAYEPVNDSTWLPSKTKYNINVKDENWDKVLIFHLENKKVISLGASYIMGD